MCVCSRRVPFLLGSVFHVQHPRRDLQQAGQGLLARRPDVHTDHVAGLHEQLRESRDLHDIQPGVPEGVQEAHANRHLTRGGRHRQEFRHQGRRQLTAARFFFFFLKNKITYNRYMYI